MDEEFYTVDVDIRETAQVNVSLRDVLNGVKCIKQSKDRLKVAFKILEAIKVSPDDLTPEQKEITKNWLQSSLKLFE